MTQKSLRSITCSQIPPLIIGAAFLAARGLAYGVLAFGNYVAFPTGSWPEAVAIADLNGDGKKDVVLTTSTYSNTNDNSVLVFFQNAQGGLDAPVQYSAGAAAISVAIADFNGDGQKDIAVGKKTLGIRVFWNGQGTFNTFTDYDTQNAYKICAGDFNHDGLADVAGVGFSASQVDVFTQLSSGGLAFSARYPATYGGNNNVAAGEMNGDGWTDIIVMSGQTYAAPNVSVLLQNQSGFAPAASYTVGPNQLTKGIGIGDVTGDGRNDVVASYGGNSPTAKIAVFGQTSQGVLSLSTNYTSYDLPQPVVIADVDMDGRFDVVTAHGGWYRAGVYLQTASGTLGPEQLFAIPYASSYNPQGLAVGDINSDGRPDIVLADYLHGLIVLYNASTPPPIRISRIERTGNGAVTLTAPYCGLHGSCVVERADSIGNWQDIGVVSDSTWTDAEPITTGARFYRLRAQ